MNPHTNLESPWWHSLMYSTGILILVCGIPGTVIAVLLIAKGASPQEYWSQSLTAGGLMIGAELVLALFLLAAAKLISARTDRRR